MYKRFSSYFPQAPAMRFMGYVRRPLGHAESHGGCMCDALCWRNEPHFSLAFLPGITNNSIKVVEQAREPQGCQAFHPVYLALFF